MELRENIMCVDSQVRIQTLLDWSTAIIIFVVNTLEMSCFRPYTFLSANHHRHHLHMISVVYIILYWWKYGCEKRVQMSHNVCRSTIRSKLLHSIQWKLGAMEEQTNIRNIAATVCTTLQKYIIHGHNEDDNDYRRKRHQFHRGSNATEKRQPTKET